MSEGQKLVMIYATGSDTDLRQMCFTLMDEGLMAQADLIDRAVFYLKNGDTPKLRASGRLVTWVCPRSQLKKTMRHMQRAYFGDDLSAYALPILARI